MIPIQLYLYFGTVASLVLGVVLLDTKTEVRRCSKKYMNLESFAKFTEQHLYWSLLFNKVTGLTSAILSKKTPT